MSIRLPHDCFTINSIFYLTNTQPLPERFSIHFLLDRYSIFFDMSNAYLPDQPLPLKLIEPDQYPTAWSGLIELI
ncbi:hypothetical protein DPMN_184153 [Dreissena polymorpha]|uniref:Uncharacterized protein n=1 Tax=Dreissena polymorpha TaxID=45954 RepID=A0A9D4I7L9_DREPO|nr:hypothetical protein DPMN_184153 [Dreissena polymorpha]